MEKVKRRDMITTHCYKSNTWPVSTAISDVFLEPSMSYHQQQNFTNATSQLFLLVQQLTVTVAGGDASVTNYGLNGYACGEVTSRHGDLYVVGQHGILCEIEC